MTEAFHPDDTIAAIASASGPAARGIVRISGRDVKGVLSQVFSPTDRRRWDSAKQPWRHPGEVVLPDVTVPLTGDVLLWPTPRSYTGESLAEVHTVGSPPLLEALLTALFEQGARPAERGEFTLRAFLAGRIDLLQAEAVLGVIDASDQQQLNAALGQLGGGLSGRIGLLHEELLINLADLEAGLDFVEEDIEFVSREDLQQRLNQGITFLEELAAQSSDRLQSTGRRRVVLAGLPNAGKSTLFNALIGNDRALVSPAAGTTRDYLSVPLNWNGLAMELVDTAGGDPAARGIHRSADELRQEQWDRADLIVWCTACDATDFERARDLGQRSGAERIGAPILQVATKGECADARSGDESVRVCALSGDGLAELRCRISRSLQETAVADRLIGSTSARCRDSLLGAGAALQQAQSAALGGAGDELIAVELREAIDHLGKIVGRVYTDDVLDRIFSRFCIGK